MTEQEKRQAKQEKRDAAESERKMAVAGEIEGARDAVSRIFGGEQDPQVALEYFDYTRDEDGREDPEVVRDILEAYSIAKEIFGERLTPKAVFGCYERLFFQDEEKE